MYKTFQKIFPQIIVATIVHFEDVEFRKFHYIIQGGKLFEGGNYWRKYV